MKKFIASFVAICIIFTSYAFAIDTVEASTTKDYEIGDTCHDMIEKWFGGEMSLFSTESKSEKDVVKGYVQRYIEIRSQSVYDDSELEDIDFLSDEVIEIENERREGFVEMQNRAEITITDSGNNVKFNSVKQNGDVFTIDAYEWVFYDYKNDGHASKYVDVSGFGTDHIITVEKTEDGYVITSDEYNESDMNGVCTVEIEEVEEEEADIPEETDDSMQLMASYYSGYKPEKAVAYSDKYALNYNSAWPNYGSSGSNDGGDCANFTSQAIHAGGMPQDPGINYGWDGWFHNSTTNRSATWTGAGELRYYMMNNRGTVVNDPDEDEIYTGSPVFYNYDGYGTSVNDWDHAVLCVGRNSSGVPIINSHTADRYHAVWTYAGIKHSTVQLTATNPDGSIPIDSFSLSPKTVYLTTGETETISATIKPSNATNKTLDWDSSKKSVATVSSSGKITAKSSGYSWVTAETTDGSDISHGVNVYVNPVRGVSLNKSSTTIYKGESETIKATVKLYDSSWDILSDVDDITWTTSNKSVATVSNGKITAKGYGNATITATTKYGGYTATCYVTVPFVYVDKVELNKNSTTINLGKSETLKATVYPDNASNKELEWTSSDTSIATVSSSGKVTAAKNKGGTVTIKAKATDGSKEYDTCSVYVPYTPVESIKIYDVASYSYKTSINLELNEGEKYELKTYIEPSDATLKDVTWTTSDKSVATVSDKGVITAKDYGTAKITVTTEDGNYKAYCYLTVKYYPVTGITISQSSAELIAKDKLTLTATVSPSNASNKTVTWTTSDKSVATVDKTGKITAKNKGTAIITATSNDNSNYKASCTVKVSTFKYDYLNGTLTITGKGEMDDYTASSYQPWLSDKNYITKVVVNTGITHIGANAFSGLTNLREISIPSTVKTIGKEAFSGCTKLNNVTLSKSVTSVGEKAFYNCSALTNLNTAAAVNYIGKDAFENTGYANSSYNWTSGALYLGKNLIDVSNSASAYFVIAEGVETIGDYALYDYATKFRTITLPKSVNTINENAFYNCTSLTAFEVNSSNKKFSAEAGVLFDKSKKTLVRYPQGLTARNYTMPASVTTIASGSFAGAKLYTLMLPAKLKTIEDYAFTNCANLTDVHYMKYEKDWNKIKIGVGNNSLALADIHYLISVTAVEISETEAEVDIYRSIQLEAWVYPENATNQDITWKSSSTKVATVDENGVVTGLKKGTATITATSVDGKKTAKCKVTVIDNIIHVTKAEMIETEVTINIGDEYALEYNILPYNAFMQDVTWSTSSAKVATVDEDGVVTGVKAGTATITVKSIDGGKTAKCKVKVVDPNIYATKITLDTKKAALYVGDEITIEATVTPDNVTFEGVTWKSSKESVAVVDEDGNVTAVGKGSATITATTADGKKKATCKITVKN